MESFERDPIIPAVSAFAHALERKIELQQQGAFVIVSACALIDVDGRVLMAQRPRDKPRGGLWEFPGGKVEAGEAPEDALIRELREELGIDVSRACVAPLTFSEYRYPDIQLLLLLYVCRQWRGRVRAVEGNLLKWVKVSALRQMDIPPADRPFIAVLHDWL